MAGNDSRVRVQEVSVLVKESGRRASAAGVHAGGKSRDRVDAWVGKRTAACVGLVAGQKGLTEIRYQWIDIGM